MTPTRTSPTYEKTAAILRGAPLEKVHHRISDTSSGQKHVKTVTPCWEIPMKFHEIHHEIHHAGCFNLLHAHPRLQLLESA
jgi:hypothetical protein